MNAVLAAALLGGLFAVVRLAGRMPRAAGRETLHRSQPLELAVVHDDGDEAELARVA